MKLNINCAALITDDVQQKHDLLRAIEAHREQFPGFAKATLEKLLVTMLSIINL